MSVRAVAPTRLSAARSCVPRATSWLLMALTALAALLGTGAEPSLRGAAAVGASAPASAHVREPATGSRADRVSQLPVPTVAGAASAAQSASGPALELPPPGAHAPSPAGRAALGQGAASTYAARVLDGGSGRGPPGTTGT